MKSSHLLADSGSMPVFEKASLLTKMKRWANYFACTVIIIAALTLAGWQFNIDFLMRPVYGLGAMNPTTAILFIFSGTSFFLLSPETKRTQKIGLGKVLACIILSTGLLRFISNLYELNFDVDTIFFNRKLEEEMAANLSSRMAPNTAFNFILSGSALLLLKTGTRRGKRMAQVIALIISFIALLAMVSFLYRVSSFFVTFAYQSMSIHTAINFLLFSFAIFFINPDSGIMGEFTGPFPGSFIARFLVPAAIIIPVLLGFLRLKAAWSGMVSLESGAALLILAIIIIFLALTWFIVVSLNKRGLLKHETDRSLRESEQQVQTIFNAAPDAVIVMDDEGKIIEWNPMAEKTLGWKRNEVIGKLLSETIIPHRFREAHEKGMKHFLETGEGPLLGKIIEILALTKSGHEIDVALNIAASSQFKGHYLFIGFLRDLTGQKKAEQKFKALLDSAPDAMIIANEKGEITLINQQTETLFGYTRNELIGQPVEILIPVNFRSRHRDHRMDYFADPRIRAMGAGLELFAMRKNGTQFPVEISLSPLQTEEGLLVSASVRDITDRKKAEEKFKSLLDAAPDATVIVNDKGRIQMINQQTENLFGYTRDEMIGQPVEILIPRDLGDKHTQHRADFFRAPKVRTMGAGIELNAVKKNGTLFPVEISLSPIQTEEGMLVSASVRDISLRKGLEDELKKSNAELEAFTYSVSHDLRAPLRGIIGFTAILEEDYSNKLDDEAKRITGVIKANTLKMGHLIDDLLAFSRTGKQEITRTQINTGAMVNDIVGEMIQQNKGSSAIDWNIHSLPAINADMNTIRQVWINLISNAIKYSGNKEQPYIEIGSYPADGQTVFYVKDNGVGFDQQYKHKLFKVFQRLHNPEEFEGTGVGLALVEKIISRHKGKVWAEAEVDQGACFYFSLPVQNKD
jgi:PAS domain S-box-containing protein